MVTLSLRDQGLGSARAVSFSCKLFQPFGNRGPTYSLDEGVSKLTQDHLMGIAPNPFTATLTLVHGCVIL